MKMNNETEQIFLLNAAPSQSSASTQKLGALELPASSQVNLEDVKDFSQVCRTCATITELVMPIFSGEGLQNNLADKISKHLPIQVSERDELPLVVCYQCASTLLAWHELVQCCLQADIALRAKLSSNERKTNIPNKSNSSAEEQTQSKYAEPPQYRDTTQLPCTYCTSSHHHTMYKEHLVTAHSDLLFHCEECDKYIDRKDFMLHMSLHAVQYTTQDKNFKRKKIKKKQDVKQIKTEHTTAPVAKTETNVSQENEFSDHSDIDGFGPLPESVFEAIEDSQLLDDTNHTPDNESFTDESNKSSQPTVENSNPALCLETNLNNCSVIIEPININNCGEIDIAVTPPDNNTASKTTDVSENDPSVGCRKKDKKTRHCPFCPKVYTASSSYFYHIKYFHKGSREHGCEVCGKKFGTRSCLTQHMAIHTGQYDFECKQCQKQFKSKASLYIHEQTHNGKKSWSCSQCHTSFRWKTHLFRHMKRHEAEKGHVCTTCGRGFTIRCDLLRHARTHTAGNFTCDKCGQKFAQLRYLKVHTVKQHSANIVKESQ